MNCKRLLFVVAGAALLLFSLPAPADVVSSVPAWNPMYMFGMEVVWNDSGNHALGGYVNTWSGISSSGPTSAASPYVSPATWNLKLVGWPLENGHIFAATDTFAAPYDVLNGTSFGRSYGWFNDTDPPAGYVWKIVLVASTPGLKVYDPYSASFDELFTSASGYAVTYNGNSTNAPGPDYVNGVAEYTDAMFHPVFSVPSQTGPVFAEFALYLALADGTIVDGVAPAYQVFNFNSTPEPATLAILAVGGAILSARRRRGASCN